jgi:AhpD family alkylhydroperoxidase
MATLDYWKLSPAGMKSLASVSQYIKSSGLEPKLIHLVYLRVSQINGCAYCCDMHSHDALEAGVSSQALHVLAAWHEAEDLFTDSEKAALAWAEAVTRFADATAVQMQGRDEAYARLLQHFSEKEVVDLTLTIAAMNAWNRIAVSFHQGPARR